MQTWACFWSRPPGVEKKCFDLLESFGWKINHLFDFTFKLAATFQGKRSSRIQNRTLKSKNRTINGKFSFRWLCDYFGMTFGWLLMTLWWLLDDFVMTLKWLCNAFEISDCSDCRIEVTLILFCYHDCSSKIFFSWPF